MGDATQNYIVDADALCKIIGMCAKSGVAKLQLGALQLVFDAKDKSVESLSMVETKPLEQEQANKIGEEVQAQELARLREDELENLKLANPLAYERFIAEGEIEDGQSP